jgi:hypothetical protein
MSDLENNKTRKNSATPKNLRRRLQRAGERIGSEPVSIRELAPDPRRDRATSRPALLLQPSAVHWSAALLAVIVICAATLHFTADRQADSGNTESIAESTQKRTQPRSDFAKMFASALTKKHRISLVPTAFTENDQSTDSVPGPTALASVSLNSLFRKRRISLSGLSGTIAELDQFEFPKVRFHLNPSDR